MPEPDDVIKPGLELVVPHSQHGGHTLNVLREDKISVDRWYCICSCGERLKIPGHLLEAMAAGEGENSYTGDIREQFALAFRDWIHEQPFSQCSAADDTCPDWQLAYEMADLAMSVMTGGD